MQERLHALAMQDTWIDRIAFQTFLTDLILQRSDRSLEAALGQIDFSFLKAVQVRLALGFITAIENSNVPNKREMVDRVVRQYREYPEFQIRMLDFVPTTFQPTCTSWKEVFQKLSTIARNASERSQLEQFQSRIGSILDGRVDLLDLRHDSSKKDILYQHLEGCLEHGTGCSLIRLGDGEAYTFGEEDDDEERQAAFKRKEQHWWGITLTSERRELVRSLIRQSVVDADVLGLPSAYRIARDWPVSSVPGDNRQPVDDLQDVIGGVAALKGQLQAGWVVEDRVHQFAFDRAWIDEIIESSKTTVIVSCWDETEFVKPFPERCHFIKLVGQVKVRRPDERGYNLIDDFEVVLEDLLSRVDRGSVVLLGGGILAKPLTTECAKKGAVAIDLGSTMDYWTGHFTRNPAEQIK